MPVTALTDPRLQIPQVIAEKVLLGGDLSVLTPTERLTYYNAVCASVGLNPLTRPFEYLALNGKLTLYARKDCTDQLRDLHGISIQIVGRELLDGVYVVTAQGKNMTERTDESIGAVPLPTSGIDKANAMMKAETKAKRRVTLSICGLGMLDETEIDTMAGAHPVPPPAVVIAETGQGDDARPHEPKSAMTATQSQQASDAPAPLSYAVTPQQPAAEYVTVLPISFTESCDRLNVAQSVKEISNVMNASLNSPYSSGERQILTKTKDQAMKRLGGKT